MSFNVIDMSELPRKFTAVFPLIRMGLTYAHENQIATFTSKLEFCLRYSSAEEFAIDLIDGVEYRTPYPHVIMKLPAHVHSYSITSPRDAVYFQYAPASEADMRAAGLVKPPYIWPIRMTPEVNSLMRKIQDLSRRSQDDYVADWLDITALQMMEILLAQREEQDNAPYYIEAKIRRIASYLNLNFTREIDLDALLTENGFSRRSFFRHWRQFYELSPADYIRELKLQYAKTQLQESNRPIWRITQDLKFQNTHYLCRLFKARFGVTPLQYRKNNHLVSTAPPPVSPQDERS
jgi:AraC-like DNA-binding protein